MARCYDPFDNEVSNRSPCSQNGHPASCCAVGDYCASNGICVTPHNQAILYFTDSCTVKGWADGSVSTCPTACIKGESLDFMRLLLERSQLRNNVSTAGGNGVVGCGKNLFCCYGQSGCDCNNSTQAFELDAVEVITTVTSLATSSISSTSSSVSSLTSVGASTSSTTAPTITASGSSGNSGNNLGLGLGVGLGVGIPLTLAVLLGFWFVGSRRRPQAELSSTGWHENTGSYPTASAYQYQASQGSRHELSSEKPPQELDGLKL
ncbi:hypothetical protein JX266_010853 [Neoarthrinium moseri]|nr:hypothetical protein JX266_010853 [Neoarthrinium moseri]